MRSLQDTNNHNRGLKAYRTVLAGSCKTNRCKIEIYKCYIASLAAMFCSIPELGDAHCSLNRCLAAFWKGHCSTEMDWEMSSATNKFQCVQGRVYKTLLLSFTHQVQVNIFPILYNTKDIQINSKNSHTNDESSLVVLFQKVQTQLLPVHSGIMTLCALTAKLWTGLKQSTVICFKELIIFALVNQVQ